MKRWLSGLLLVLCSMHVLAAGNDNPVLMMLTVEELEWREDDEVGWDAEAWIGKDLDKLWFKTEGEYTSEQTEEFELQALYNRSITPFWNLQTGWRGDFQPVQERNWFALGVAGLIPGFVRTELTGFIADGRGSARLKARYHLFLTQRWLLVPRLETNWYSESDPVNGLGDGLADLEIGLRLHYRIRPNLTPYLGVSWTGLCGETSDLAEADGDDRSNWKVLAGLSFWL